MTHTETIALANIVEAERATRHVARYVVRVMLNGSAIERYAVSPTIDGGITASERSAHRFDTLNGARAWVDAYKKHGIGDCVQIFDADDGECAIVE